jgi:hypothetical protein
MESIADNYCKDGFDIISLNDNHVLIIDGEKKRVI